MAISKIILNGVTQMDLTADTVEASNLLQSYTAHKNDGTQVTGTLVPNDCPIFTIVLDSIDATLVSITCNKTFSECVNYVAGSDFSHLHNEAIAKKYNSNNQFIQSFGLSGGDDSDDQGRFVAYGTIALDDVYTIRYNEDGTFQLISTWTDLYPIATKGAVTNHSISVTPSVDQQSWGLGKRYTGTPVTISASELVSGSETKTANGTYDVTNLAELVVNVSSNNPNLQSKTNISPTISSQTITADSGYDGLSSVQINAMPSGTAGTPSATKGTVSNHSVSVTPSVTNTTGYITGSTKTGTAVTVSASELVSGSETKTANGTYDVTNLASLIVNVPTGGASNFVTGTFTGTTTGAAMDVTIPYTGSGYPIAISIYPKGGFRGNSTFSNAIQRYATGVFLAVKGDTANAPTYDDTTQVNSAYVFTSYKSSTSTSSNYSQNSGANTNLYRDQSSSSNATSNVKIKNKTKMSVFIASNSYGFMANVEYTYHIIYSS